jgi:hypothetical protein
MKGNLGVLGGVIVITSCEKSNIYQAFIRFLLVMSTESELLIKEYAKNPINNFKMKDATVTQHEGNFIC